MKQGDLEFLPHILNEKNKLITEEFVLNLLEKYGVKIKIKSLETFQKAMIHESYIDKEIRNEKTAKVIKEVEQIDKKLIKKALPLQKESYEVLEYLGDSVIHAILAEYLFKRYEYKDQGFLTKLRARIEQGETLSRLAIKIGLNKYLIISRNLEMSESRFSSISINEDIFEAFMGALKLETTYENCYKFVISILEKEEDIAELINNDDEYKGRLMAYFHNKGYHTTPTYVLYETIDVKPKKLFKMKALDPDGKVVGYGMAGSKLEAEKLAAKEALIKFGVIKLEEDEEEYYYE
jgi:dsRNA-specific ribonuclease